MKTAVQCWGNSLALRIPKPFADEIRIRAGSEVEMTLKSGTVVIQPVRKKRCELGALLKQITPANRHAELPSGRAVGREAW